MININELIMPFFDIVDKLPDENEYVLIHLTKNNWGDLDDPNEKRYWKVAKFIKGITKEARVKMKAGELPDPVKKCINRETKRSSIYYPGDVHGNNHVPYYWDSFGPGGYFGQEVNIWARLPILERL